MTTPTDGLAAVHAAAESISRADHEAALTAARTEGDAAGFARGRAEGLAAGGAAERTRIAAITAIGRPGFGALIAECIADPSCSAGDAALRIIAAENEQLGRQAQAIKDVEQVTGTVAAAPAASAATLGTTVAADTADGWKAEWSRNPALQADFPTADRYAAYMAGVKAGRIRVLKTATAG